MSGKRTDACIWLKKILGKVSWGSLHSIALTDLKEGREGWIHSKFPFRVSPPPVGCLVRQGQMERMLSHLKHFPEHACRDRITASKWVFRRFLLGAGGLKKWGCGLCPSGTDGVVTKDPGTLWQGKVGRRAKSQPLDVFSTSPLARWNERTLLQWDLIIRVRCSGASCWLGKPRAHALSGGGPGLKTMTK